MPDRAMPVSSCPQYLTGQPAAKGDIVRFRHGKQTWKVVEVSGMRNWVKLISIRRRLFGGWVVDLERVATHEEIVNQ